MFLTDLAIAFGRLVASELKGPANAILGQLRLLADGDDDAEAEIADGEPLYAPLGVYGRPNRAADATTATAQVPEGYAEAVGIRIDDKVIPLAFRDLRLSKQVTPEEGEVGMVHMGGGFVNLRWNLDGDGSALFAYVPRKDSSGAVIKASYVSIDSTDTNQHLALVHELGQSIWLTKDKKIIVSNAKGDAYVEINDDAVVLNGKAVVPGGLLVGATNPALAQSVVAYGTTLPPTDFFLWMTQVQAAIAALAAAAGGLVPPLVVPTGTPLPTLNLKAT